MIETSCRAGSFRNSFTTPNPSFSACEYPKPLNEGSIQRLSKELHPVGRFDNQIFVIEDLRVEDHGCFAYRPR